MTSDPPGARGDARPLLLLLNGAPGVGKSTLARCFVDAHPGALALDVDVLRGSIGGWAAEPLAAGQQARRLAVACAREHLGSGRDVVLPQLVTREDFPRTLSELADERAARFVEVLLEASPERAAARFADRTRRAERPEHRDAAASGGLMDLRRRLDAFTAERPGLLRLDADGSLGETYAGLLRLLSRAP